MASLLACEVILFPPAAQGDSRGVINPRCGITITHTLTQSALWRTLDFIARVWNKRGAVGKSRRQKAEGRRQKAESRRQKAEGGRQKAEGRRQSDFWTPRESIGLPESEKAEGNNTSRGVLIQAGRRQPAG
jgi:hypothetical protein